jgi:hypothetical protein
MSLARRSTVPVTALVLFAACAGPRKSLESLLAPPTPLTTFSFDLYNNHIYVWAVVNSDSAWLVLDSGTPHTWLDSSWAMGIGAVPVASKLERFSEVSIDSIVVGGLRLRNHRAQVTSTALVSQASGRPIRGVLGFGSLRRFTVEIDPAAGLVQLYDPATYWYAGPGTVVPTVLRRGYLVARAEVDLGGRRAVRAHLVLDTGASRLCVIFSRRFVSTHPQLGRLRSVEGTVGVALDGRFEGRIVRLDELRLGGFVARAPTAGLPGEGSEKILDFPEDGVVGNGVLTRTGVVFDYARERIILARPQIDADACPYDMSGLFLSTNGPSLEGIRVTHVAPDSPASEAGVHLGDEILAVDARPVAELTLWGIREALSVQGVTRELLLRRGADSISVALKLRPLL